MSVDPRLRRSGHARRMLAAAEALCAARGCTHLTLHCRLGDDAAEQLYLSAGFAVVDADSWLVKLRGITPRALMCKQLPLGGQGGRRGAAAAVGSIGGASVAAVATPPR